MKEVGNRTEVHTFWNYLFQISTLDVFFFCTKSIFFVMSFALLRVCNNKKYGGYKNQLCFDEYISSLVFGIEIFEVL